MTTPVELKTFLDLLGTLGTIKIGALPASPDECGAIYEYGGKAPEERFGIVGIGFEYPAFQIVFRGAPEDYATPRGLAETAWRSLAGIQPGALCAGVTTKYLEVKPQQSPFPLASPDTNKRIKIGFNFYVRKEPS